MTWYSELRRLSCKHQKRVVCCICLSATLNATFILHLSDVKVSSLDQPSQWSSHAFTSQREAKVSPFSQRCDWHSIKPSHHEKSTQRRTSKTYLFQYSICRFISNDINQTNSHIIIAVFHLLIIGNNRRTGYKSDMLVDSQYLEKKNSARVSLGMKCEKCFISYLHQCDCS